MGIKENMLATGDCEMIQTAVRICRGYLQGPWKKISSDDVIVKRLSGGLSNILYHVQLTKNEETAKQKEVLLRFYGQTHGEGALENLITESVIFTLLSERKVGPKLFGVFPGGRIEEFLPASPLKSEEMCDPDVNLLVAEKIASVHSMNVPINKEPRWMWDTIQRWLNTLASSVPSNNSIEDKLMATNWREEADWLKTHLSKIFSPVVFCHNDLQAGNILRKESSPDEIVIIDFEYCAYNNRGFDLANHFAEWAFDNNHPEPPYYAVHNERYCPPAQMHRFIEKYLSAMCYKGDPRVMKPEVNNVKCVMREIKHYTLASHLFWGIWSMVNAKTSKITFGYWEYAQERLTAYMTLKEAIIRGQKENAAIKRKVTDMD